MRILTRNFKLFLARYFLYFIPKSSGLIVLTFHNISNNQTLWFESVIKFISEKYGFELVDSGDFYYLFMYLVFLGFSLRPLLTSIDYNDSFRNIFSLKLFLDFYLTLIYYFFKKR